MSDASNPPTRAPDNGAPLATRTAHYNADTGYGFIATLPTIGWQPVSAWGVDGWDLGQWPLVAYAVRQEADTVEVLEYIEGDITIRTYADEADAVAALDIEAAYWWGCHGNGPADPVQGVGPYSGSLLR